MDKTVDEHPFAFTPFSAGPRNCLGMHMTMMEVKILIVYFFKNFNMMLNESTKLRLSLHLIVHPEDDRLIKI
jgi:cytochrome P450